LLNGNEEPMRQLSIRSKIILCLLATGLACLAAGGVIGYRSGDAALTRSVERQLTAQRELKRQRVESYIKNQLRFTQAIGGAPETIAATQAFIAAFRDMHADVAAGEQADTAALSTWYTKSFMPSLDKVAGGHPPLDGLMPADPVARRLQADYIARNTAPEGQKSALLAAPGGSRYDAVHAKYHAVLKRAAQTVGFYDINLMDAATGDVVYTVAKEPDFASNMYHGPFSRSGFADVARRALDPENGGKAVMADYSAYMPSAFVPQIFTAVPVIADGQTIGVFVAQIDVGTLNGLLTDGGHWQETGQGRTGEVLMVGEDRLLRSQSRFMATDPGKFLADAQANGLPQSVADQVRTLGTTILHMPEQSSAVEGAFHNKAGIARFVDYRGVDVVSAYGPLEIAGLRWAIEAKQDVGEAFAPATQLARDLVVAAAAASIVLTFLALACARIFTRPLERVIAAMRRLIAGEAVTPLPAADGDEFAALNQGFNGTLALIHERDQRITAAERRADDLLRSVYPAGLAERIRSGAAAKAEVVANTTVAVVWIDGLDALAVTHDAVAMSEVLNTLLDVIGTSAASHGVEPVRSLGESHIFICGLSSPQLDHASRTLGWVRSAAQAVQRLGTDWAAAISLRFGLASGEIAVFLLGRGNALHDVWGQTLSVARLIAVHAEPGSVRVSESTYALLTNVDGFVSAPAIEAPVLGAVKTWSCPALPTRADAAPGQPAHAAE
jgi:class 3 adenylate cyclase